MRLSGTHLDEKNEFVTNCVVLPPNSVSNVSITTTNRFAFLSQFPSSYSAEHSATVMAEKILEVIDFQYRSRSFVSEHLTGFFAPFSLSLYAIPRLQTKESRPLHSLSLAVCCVCIENLLSFSVFSSFFCPVPPSYPARSDDDVMARGICY